MTQVIWDKSGQDHSEVTNADELSKILEQAREDGGYVPGPGKLSTCIFTSLTPDKDESYPSTGKSEYGHYRPCLLL